MEHLLTILDDELRTLTDLVACTQLEQQHLLAFEPGGLEEVVGRKQRLLDREDQHRRQREAAVRTAMAERGLGGETLTDLIDALPETLGRALSDRRDSLRAILTALQELTAVSAFHATRHLRFTRMARRKLAGTQHSGPAYDRSGSARREMGGGLSLNACV